MRRLTAFALAIALSPAAFAQGVSVEFKPASVTVVDGYQAVKDGEGLTFYVAADALITNDDIVAASAEVDPLTHKPVVSITFGAAGGNRFADYTSAHVGELVAVIVDGVVLSAPRIMSPVLGGTVIINGQMSMADATRIASGILPSKEK
jgi:preprotein translocase subunit SecD